MKRSWRLFWIIGLLLFVVAVIPGTGFAASKKIRISQGNSMTHPQGVGLRIFKEYVEKNTGGKLEVAIYPNSQLGGERESVEQVKNGILEMATACAGPASTFNKNFMVLDIPFLFDNYEEAWMTIDSEAGRALLASSEQVGLKGLAFLENGFRHVTNTKRPIVKLEDFQGLKIRTMEAPMHMENFRQLGANPTPVPWPELYMALQQKIADGQENPLNNIWEVKMYEVQTYCSLTGHIYDPLVLLANLKWFNSLPKDQQIIIEQGAILAQNYSRFINKSREDELRRLLTAKGLKVNDITKEEKARMRQASQKAVIEAVKKNNVNEKFITDWLKGIEVVREDIASGL